MKLEVAGKFVRWEGKERAGKGYSGLKGPDDEGGFRNED